MSDGLDAALSFPRGFTAGEVEWPLRRVGDLVELRYGKALTEPSRRPGDVRVYGSNGQCGWHDESLANGPTVVLGRKGQGPLGVEWCDRPFWVIDTAYFASTRSDDCYLKYFYYIAKYVGLNHLKDGTSNPSLSRDRFYRQAYPLPPADVQRRIVDVLSTHDDLIDNIAARVYVLRKLADLVYDEWFVKFRTPRIGVANGRASRIDDVPDGWSAATLGDALTLQRGFDLPHSDRQEGSVPIISSAGITGFHHVAKVLGPGVVTGRYGTLGEVYLSEEAFWPLNTALFVKDFKGNSVYWALHQLRALDFGARNAAGAVPGVNRNALHLLPVVIPAKDVQARFDEVAGVLHRQAARLSRLSGHVQRLRDALLPRLLGGSTRLK